MQIKLTVNGTARSDEVEPRLLLVHYLREVCGLRAANVGCDTTSCGACTVLLDGDPVRSCIVLAAQADGHDLRTIEGLADGDRLHPVQEAFIEHHALQCGFCTPGFVMLAVSILEREPAADAERIVQLLSSNICRCTGYKPIVAAVLSAQRAMAAR